MPVDLARPSRGDLAILGVAVVCVSMTAPLIAATEAPALAVAFWRCLLGAAVLGVWVGIFRRDELRRLGRRDWTLIALAGCFLGAHLATWVPSLRFTSVAASTALVATQPVWAALIARARGVHVPRAAWLGIAVAFAGVLALTGIDVSLDPRALIGDGLALAGAVLAAAYVTVAEQARATVSTLPLTFIMYAWAAGLVLVVTLAFDQPLTGFSTQAWSLIIALTIVGQLLGHTLVNRVLATTSATVVSLAILFEMPGATLIAAIMLGQMPPLVLVPAVLLVFAGLVIVIRAISASPDPVLSGEVERPIG